MNYPYIITSRRQFHVLIIALVLTLVSCNSGDKRGEVTQADNAHTSENSLDWWGIYLGTVPCTDCEGIRTSLTLNRNFTYLLTREYLGKNGDVTAQRGPFTWSTDGRTVILGNPDSGPNQFRVEENAVMQLDTAGKPVTGDLASKYRLLRTPESRIAGVRWNLDNLMDKHMRMNPAYIQFDQDKGIVSGFGWCNNFQAPYTLVGDEGISFGEITAGTNICKDTTLEKQLLNMFTAVEGFTLKDNTLGLYRVKNSPVAIFNRALLRGAETH